MAATDEPSFDWAKLIAERQIQDAMEAGEFDNLPGAGKPLDLDEDSFVPMSVRLLNKILKNSGAVPVWIQTEKDLRKELEEIGPFKERGLRLLRHSRNAASRDRAAHRLRTGYQERMEFVNNLIFKYNYIAPGGAMRVFFPYKIKEEMTLLEQEITAAGE